MKHGNCSDRHGQYSSLDDASQACSADATCYGIVDPGCSNKGYISLCHSEIYSANHHGSCAYLKGKFQTYIYYAMLIITDGDACQNMKCNEQLYFQIQNNTKWLPSLELQFE